MKDDKLDEIDTDSLAKKEYAFKEMASGFVWSIVGGGITLISMFLSDEEYLVFYGLTFWGVFLILKGLYYYLKPSSIPSKKLI